MRWFFIAAGLALFLSLGSGAAHAASPDDSRVYALIDALAPVGEAIDVDGTCDDWGAIPVFPDPTGDAGGDPTRDITGVAIAPLDDELVVRIDTAGTPPATAQDFWIQVDYRRQQFWDLTFSLSSTFQWFDFFPESGEGSAARIPFTIGVIAAGASCVEARIPYAALDPLLPVVMQGQLSGASARSWVRVRATTGEPLDFFDSEIDHGSAVGSFRLVATPYDLDPALPAGSASAHETRLPLRDTWYLGQGSHGVGTHQGIPWAYDWHRVDNALLPEVPQRSADNADNFSFDEPIVAPQGGTVFSLLDTEPDCTPYASCGGTQVNFVFLEVPGDVGILFSHTAQGSIPVQANDPVLTGAPLGNVGNSGSNFSFAHLHHEGRDISGVHTAIPLALMQVDVGLNPDPEADPWARYFPRWGPREGFFARTGVPRSVPALGPRGGLALVSALTLSGAVLAVWRLRRS